MSRISSSFSSSRQIALISTHIERTSRYFTTPTAIHMSRLHAGIRFFFKSSFLHAFVIFGEERPLEGRALFPFLWVLCSVLVFFGGYVSLRFGVRHHHSIHILCGVIVTVGRPGARETCGFVYGRINGSNCCMFYVSLYLYCIIRNYKCNALNLPKLSQEDWMSDYLCTYGPALRHASMPRA
jgi:hypothetical protein